jgi:hypothetical protein
LTRNKFPVTQCRFIALLKDHSKTDAIRNRNYPQNPVFIYEFPVTAEKLFKIGAHIRSKTDVYKKYLSAADDDIPPCLPEERWERPSEYAVKKEGVKKAVKLFGSKREAEERVSELGAGYFVEHRAGECIKCTRYCLCNSFCNFYQNTSGKNSAHQFEAVQNEEKAAA